MAQLSEVARGLLGRELKPWQVDYLDGSEDRIHDSLCAVKYGEPCDCQLQPCNRPLGALSPAPAHMTKDLASRVKALVWIEEQLGKKRRLAVGLLLGLSLISTSCTTIDTPRTHLEFNDFGQVVEMPDAGYGK